jgi:hypothetical protein
MNTMFLPERDHLEELSVDGKIILVDSKIRGCGHGMGSYASG